MWFQRLQKKSWTPNDMVWEEFYRKFPQYQGLLGLAAGSNWVNSYQFYRDLFLHMPWSENYGGRPWYNIVNALEDLERKYQSGVSFQQMYMSTDQVFDLVHNTDSVFDKGDESLIHWLRQALDLKRHASPSLYIHKCSPEIQRLYKLYDRGTTYRPWWETVKTEKVQGATSLFRAMIDSHTGWGGHQFVGIRDILNSDLIQQVNIEELGEPYRTVYYFISNYHKIIDRNFGRHTMINSLISYLKQPTNNFVRRLIQSAIPSNESVSFIKMLVALFPNFWSQVKEEKISLEMNPEFVKIMNLTYKPTVKSSHVKLAFINQSDFFDFYALTEINCEELDPEYQKICFFERKRVVDTIVPALIEFLKFAIRQEASHIKDIFGLSTQL